LEKIKQLQGTGEETLTEENMQQLLLKWDENGEIVLSKLNIHCVESTSTESLPLIASERKLLELSSRLFEEEKEQSKEKKRALIEGFSQLPPLTFRL
jgi:hypothetical protein